MEFSELPRFTKRVAELLDDGSYAALQFALIEHPEAGALIVHGVGLRKIRWAIAGRGKRGGVRAIYYWQAADGMITMAAIYAKNEKENLSPAEIAEIKKELGR